MKLESYVNFYANRKLYKKANDYLIGKVIETRRALIQEAELILLGISNDSLLKIQARMEKLNYYHLILKSDDYQIMEIDLLELGTLLRSSSLVSTTIKIIQGVEEE